MTTRCTTSRLCKTAWAGLGTFIAIECKAGKGKTTALQDMELAKIQQAGGTALVINEENIELVKQTLKELLCE